MKELAYLGILTGLFIAVGSLLGGTVGTIIAFFIAMVINFFSYWFSDKLVLMIYGAKELKPSESPNLHHLVEELARKAQLPKPKIFLIPMPMPNAFATGRNKNHAVIGITLGILEQLSKEELKGVIGHELSHIKNKDILIGAIAATLAGAITIVGRIAYYSAFFIPSKDRNNMFGIFLSHLLIIIVTPLIALLIKMAISRSREYLADKSAAHICGGSAWLIDALKKINNYS